MERLSDNRAVAFLLWSVGISNPVMPVTAHLEMEADKLKYLPFYKKLSLEALSI